MNREEAIEYIKVLLDIYDFTEDFVDALDIAIEALSKDKTNKPHGEWINRENCQVDEDAYEVATCSNCKSEITIEYPHDNFYPNCGARMI